MNRPATSTWSGKCGPVRNNSWLASDKDGHKNIDSSLHRIEFVRACGVAKLRRAPKIRVRKTSCLAWPAPALLLVSATLFLLGFQLIQIAMQAVEFLFPSVAIILDPVRGILKGSRCNAAGTPLSGLAAGDKSSVFKDFQMLRDSRHAHFKRLRKLGNRCLARHQMSQNRPPRRIG